ncbi:MAG: L,D-transpeptidase [Dehalococcoidia bacterium]
MHAQASSTSPVVTTLHYEQQLDLLAKVRGERYVVGDQTWPMAIEDWSNLWYKIDGGYVYSAYVWIPRAGEVLPEALGGGEHWVDVNLATQSARLMIGNSVVYTAPVTTGKNGYETPTGHWRVNYQVPNETMTSSQAGINDPNEHYDVHNVLFTQYFDGAGDALHLNYWQPESVFGNARTSHGCVGLFIRDAQYVWMFGQAGMRVEINSNGRILPPPAPPPAAATTVPTAAPTQRPAVAPSARTAMPRSTPAPAAAASATPGASPADASPTPAPATVSASPTPVAPAAASPAAATASPQPGSPTSAPTTVPPGQGRPATPVARTPTPTPTASR